MEFFEENGPVENIEIARFMAKSYTDEHFGQTEPMPTENTGDVNGDGNITTTDAVILSRYLANWNEYDTRIVAEYCNIDTVSKITSKDIAILLRHIGNWNGYETIPINP